MHRRGAHHSTSQYGWSTTSQEYLDHIRRMERTPTILLDGPQYPTAHTPINQSATLVEAREYRPHNTSRPYDKGSHREPRKNPQKQDTSKGGKKEEPHKNHQKQHTREGYKKVHFDKFEKIIDADKGKTEWDEVKSIDMEADDFIKMKHKNFEMSKLVSFNAY